MQFLTRNQTAIVASLCISLCAAIASCTKSGKLDVVTAQQYTVNAAKLTNAIAVLNSSFTQSSEITFSLKPHLTADEQIALDDAAFTLAKFHAQVNKLMGVNGSVTDLLVNAATIKPMYISSREAYIKARNVIVLHWDTLSPANQALLKEFDAQAQKAHQAIMAIQSISNNADSPVDITQAVSDFISVGAAAAQVLHMTRVLK